MVERDERITPGHKSTARIINSLVLANPDPRQFTGYAIKLSVSPYPSNADDRIKPPPTHSSLHAVIAAEHARCGIFGSPQCVLV